MENNNKIKSERTCLSHECNDCGRKLDARLSLTSIVTLVVIYGVMIGGLFLVNSKFERDLEKPQCFTRYYVSGRGTDYESVITQDVDCLEFQQAASQEQPKSN